MIKLKPEAKALYDQAVNLLACIGLTSYEFKALDLAVTMVEDATEVEREEGPATMEDIKASWLEDSHDAAEVLSADMDYAAKYVEDIKE